LTLSYDFAFLAAVRLVLDRQSDIKVKVTRCGASPLKRRPVMEDNSTLAYCAAASALLTREKVLDDINDSRGAERFRARLLRSPAESMAKKAEKTPSGLPVAEVRDALGELSRLEEEGCPSVDSCADCFGRALSCVFSFGLGGAEKHIAEAVGMSVGRLIYVMDAADDREKDKKTGSFNPLNIEPISNESLSCAVRIELSKALNAVNLMDFEGMTELRELIYNILVEGIPKEADRIFFGSDRKEKGEEQ
ncbi:MAG: hypothetical protein IJD22_06485, partial [Clostridia bacterium]|nr:hypothetical protein [Clostridia bacterium]